MQTPLTAVSLDVNVLEADIFQESSFDKFRGVLRRLQAVVQRA